MTGVRLAWKHDPRRGCAPGAELVVHTALPTREVAHLERLLAEHVARVTLAAPVQALSPAGGGSPKLLRMATER